MTSSSDYKSNYCDEFWQRLEISTLIELDKREGDERKKKQECVCERESEIGRSRRRVIGRSRRKEGKRKREREREREREKKRSRWRDRTKSINRNRNELLYYPPSSYFAPYCTGVAEKFVRRKNRPPGQNLPEKIVPPDRIVRKKLSAQIRIFRKKCKTCT